jgi:hypothetical protein
MPKCFDPRLDVLPAAQREVWEGLAPAAAMGFVLYGGTAIALQLGHRRSIDFDFFRFDPLDKNAIRAAMPFLDRASVQQDGPNTLVVSASMPSGPVKLSFFGGIGFGRVNDPVQSNDGVMFVASLDDLMATKLKAILDRAEVKDYRDLAAMISAGASLPKALSAFRAMFRAEPRTALMAIGYFEDGDIKSLTPREKQTLTNARDSVGHLPELKLIPGSLAAETGPHQGDAGIAARPEP